MQSSICSAEVCRSCLALSRESLEGIQVYKNGCGGNSACSLLRADGPNSPDEVLIKESPVSEITGVPRQEPTASRSYGSKDGRRQRLLRHET